MKSYAVDIDADRVKELFRRLADGAGESVRPAAQAGAQVIYDAVRANVARSKQVTGNLYNSIYQVYSAKESAPGVKATYAVSWNYKKAPHGILVHFGHLVRYKYYQDENGNVRPMVRPERKGDTPPKKSASRAVKDAYYVTLDTPFKTTPNPFMLDARRVFPQAAEAMMAELTRRINDRLEGR